MIYPGNCKTLIWAKIRASFVGFGFFANSLYSIAYGRFAKNRTNFAIVEFWLQSKFCNSLYQNIIFISWILILWTTILEGSIHWKSQAQDQFFVKVEIPKTDITLSDLLEIELTVTYPESYQLDSKALRDHLVLPVEYGGSLFQIHSERSKIVRDRQANNFVHHIHYKLEPQVLGTHKITFMGIPFIPQEGNLNKRVEIFSDLFSIDVEEVPSEPFKSAPKPPLFSFAKAIPIEMNTINHEQLTKTIESARKQNESLDQSRKTAWIILFVITSLLISFLVIVRKLRA